VPKANKNVAEKAFSAIKINKLKGDFFCLFIKFERFVHCLFFYICLFNELENYRQKQNSPAVRFFLITAVWRRRSTFVTAVVYSDVLAFVLAKRPWIIFQTGIRQTWFPLWLSTKTSSHPGLKPVLAAVLSYSWLAHQTRRIEVSPLPFSLLSNQID